MDQVTGGIVTLGLAVIGVAAIFQLSKPGGNKLAGTAGSVVNTTVGKLFS
jgi:hypothetical protein